MVNPKTGRVVSQDDWKRTQVRMPQTLYEDIVEYASNNDMSLNHSMIFLMDMGLHRAQPKSYKIEFKDCRPHPMDTNNQGQYLNPYQILLASAKMASDFVSSNIEYKLIQLENILEPNRDGKNALIGIRVWYSHAG